MRVVGLIVIHCSDSDVQSHDNIETIRKWHVKENGWSDIGYHFFIDKSGVVHIGRPEAIAGAHVSGHNKRSIGICLSGRKLFTDDQFRSLEKLCSELCKKYGLERTDILGHCDLQPMKTCPNFDHHRLISSWSF